MINIENNVYTNLATAVRTAFPGVNVQGTLTLNPTAFPTVCIEETDNYSVREQRDSSHNDLFAHVHYEVNVYSDKVGGAKTECKSICTVIDNEMEKMGFTRTAKITIPAETETVFRMICRYTAVAGSNNKIYWG